MEEKHEFDPECHIQATLPVIHGMYDKTELYSQRLAEELLQKKEEVIWEAVMRRLGQYVCLKLVQSRITRHINDGRKSEVWCLDEKPLIYFTPAVSENTGYIMSAKIYYYAYKIGEDQKITLH